MTFPRKAAVVAAVVALATLSLGSATAAGPGRAEQRSASPFFVGMRATMHARGATQADPSALAGVPSALECAVRKLDKANTKLDCDEILPNNEPQIIVNPTDPKNMIASSNDYGSCCDQFYTTLNGGRKWFTGNMSVEDDTRTGSDPVTTFDPAHGTAIHSSLNYQFTNSGETTDGDVVASVSTDGGINWDVPVEVYSGLGADSDPLQYFNDKEWITTDTNPASPYYGRTYLTWTRFKSEFGQFKESPIWESHSDDGGYTWSTAHQISGSNPNCTFQVDGPAGVCDEDQFSVPAVAPDGTVYVSFQNEQNSSSWEPHEVFESQYMVVKSTDGGVTWRAPVHIANMEDGSRDYPLNVRGRQTVTDYQVRLSNIGNIAVSPIDGSLYQVWSDNTNGLHDVHKPVTNTDVWYSMSTDRGATWSRKALVDPRTTDQWFPWVDVNPVTGQVGVLYNSRYVSDPSLYGAKLATMPPGGGRATYRWANTKPSHPRESIFFQAKGGGCPNCAVFHGDYIGLDYDANGVAQMVWTDMRQPFRLHDRTGYLQFIDYASLRRR